jgi:hypothetical protein
MVDGRQRMRRMRVRIVDADYEPRIGLAWVAKWEGDTAEGLTNVEGLARFALPLTVEEFSIKYDDIEVSMELGIVESPDTAAGAYLRLYNLGYHPGDDSESFTPELITALREFKNSQGLTLSETADASELDIPTQEALVRAHGH